MVIESLDNLSISERDTLFASTLLKIDANQNEANWHLVAQILHLIPDKDREIVELRLDGLRPREIAQTIGSTVGSVQKRWERILEWLIPIALNLDTLVDCLPEEKDRWVMERYLDGQSLSEIARAIGLSRFTIEQTVKRVIKEWKKAAKQNPADPVSAMVDNER